MISSTARHSFFAKLAKTTRMFAAWEITNSLCVAFRCCNVNNKLQRSAPTQAAGPARFIIYFEDIYLFNLNRLEALENTKSIDRTQFLNCCSEYVYNPRTHHKYESWVG